MCSFVNVALGVKFHSLCQNTESLLFKVQQVDKSWIKRFLKEVEAEYNVILKLPCREPFFFYEKLYFF